MTTPSTCEHDRERHGRVYFDAVLSPHRSLSETGFIILMSAVAGVGILIGTAFWLMGAWPVAGFCGLEIGLMYLMFRLNYQAARVRERLLLTDTGLTVERTTARGMVSRWDLAPNWLRVSIDDPPEHHSQLRLSSHGMTLVVGAFLVPEERLEVARALGAALERWRGAPA